MLSCCNSQVTPLLQTNNIQENCLKTDYTPYLIIFMAFPFGELTPLDWGSCNVSSNLSGEYLANSINVELGSNPIEKEFPLIHNSIHIRNYANDPSHTV